MRRLHYHLTTADGRTINTTPANSNPVLCDRNTPPPQPGAVLVDPSDGKRYLLTGSSAEISRGITHYYSLTLLELKHSINIQRLGSSRIDPEPTSIASDIPAYLDDFSPIDDNSPDRNHTVFRVELRTPPIAGIRKNDRIVMDSRNYRVIDTEPLPHITRIIAVDDYR